MCMNLVQSGLKEVKPPIFISGEDDSYHAIPHNLAG